MIEPCPTCGRRHTWQVVAAHFVDLDGGPPIGADHGPALSVTANHDQRDADDQGRAQPQPIGPESRESNDA